ncbi:MAG TPA: cytochrome P450 [Trebonia sp.]|nr:cytochrome P450 [Trebonia sp.]
MTIPPGPPTVAETEFELLGALFSPAGRADPQVILRGSPLPGCQYPFVRNVLRDPRFAAPAIPPSPDPAFQLLGRWMIRLEGDRHRRVRDAFGGLFTARRVGRYRSIIAERAAALIDRAAPAGRMDLVADFALPLPFTVINDVLGVPLRDRDWLGEALAVLNRGFASQRDTDRSAVQAANDAAQQMLSYFSGLLDQRTGAPADDLMSALASRHADGEDRQDLVANCIFFINAGHQTTTALLTLGTHLLCTHPEVLAALQEDPGRWPAAVEEMLRLITPTTFTGVTPRTDADIDGVTCPAGQPRLLFLAAANRDPSAFPDPDRFDISRDPNPHLSFSAGGHFCLGAPIARMHGEVALSTLFTQLGGLAALTPPDTTASVPTRQIDRFTVTWQHNGRDARGG